MNKTTAQITTGLLLLLSVFLMGMDGTATGGVRQEGLAEQQRELRERIKTLRTEQDLLLFQKKFSVMDSRYLVLDLAGGRGQLKYRTRVFLDFTFRPLSKSAIRAVPRGARVLTHKIEGNDGRFSLVFGPDFILRTKSAAPSTRPLPQITVSPKDMRSIFFALEQGSIAYILR